MSDVIYFAYGSNLDQIQVVQRIGDVELVGVGYIEGYSLAFNKRGIDGTAKANLYAEHPKAKTWGAFYAVTPEQFKTMASYEGGYVKIWVQGQLATIRPEDYTSYGEPFTAATFISGNFSSVGYPSPVYKERILTGMVELGLPPQLIANLEQVRTITPYNPKWSNGNGKGIKRK